MGVERAQRKGEGGGADGQEAPWVPREIALRRRRQMDTSQESIGLGRSCRGNDWT